MTPIEQVGHLVRPGHRRRHPAFRHVGQHHVGVGEGPLQRPPERELHEPPLVDLSERPVARIRVEHLICRVALSMEPPLFSGGTRAHGEQHRLLDQPGVVDDPVEVRDLVARLVLVPHVRFPRNTRGGRRERLTSHHRDRSSGLAVWI